MIDLLFLWFLAMVLPVTVAAAAQVKFQSIKSISFVFVIVIFTSFSFLMSHEWLIESMFCFNFLQKLGFFNGRFEEGSSQIQENGPCQWMAFELSFCPAESLYFNIFVQVYVLKP